MADTLQKDVDVAVKNLRKFGKGMSKKELQKPLTKGAYVLRDGIKGFVPKSKKAHSRYNTPKLISRLRAPHGRGVKVATYEPENLRRSVSVLKFRQSRSVFVGFKLDKKFRFGGQNVTYRGRKVDGYYAVMRMELGAAPVRKGVAATKGAVGTVLIREIGRMAGQLERAIQIQ